MEIGSSFDFSFEYLGETQDTIYRFLSGFHCIYTSSGRSAIRLFRQFCKPSKVLLPDYMCDCVINEFVDKAFYHINRDFSIDMNSLIQQIDNDVSAVYLMHYFGHLQNENDLKRINTLREKYGFIIVEDTTHSIFSSPCTIGDYCICSLRKWLPIPDGGVLYSSKRLGNINFRNFNKWDANENINAMFIKNLHLKYNIECKDIYRNKFKREEQIIDSNKDAYLMSDISKIFLKYLSVNDISKKRIENMNILNELGLNCCISFENNEIPFVFPMYLKNRDFVRTQLCDNNIYCPVLWPVECSFNEVAKEISDNIIMIPIDQRYNSESMNFIVNNIKVLV